MPRDALIQIRRGTTAQWAAADAASGADPTRLLADGERGLNTTTGEEKIGTATPTLWSALPVAGSNTFVAALQTQALITDVKKAFEVVSASTGAGKWVFQVVGATFNGTPDSVANWGYNVNSGGAPTIASEPAIYWQLESDYNDGSKRTMEAHLDLVFPTPSSTTIAAGSNGQTLPQATVNVASTTGWPKAGVFVVGGSTVAYTGKTGTSFTGCTGGTAVLATGNAVTPGGTVGNAMASQRPIMIQWNRVTGEMTQFGITATSLAIVDWATGIQTVGMGAGTFTLLAVPGLPSSLAIQAPTGQGSAFYLQHGGANALTIATVSANIVSWSVGIYPAVLFAYADRGVSINAFDNTCALTVQSTADLAASPTVKVMRQASGATGDLQQWTNESSVVLSRVGKGGRIMTRVNSAPADADVATSECAWWFDNTIGACKAMFKGKDSAGTVVTGSLALA